jgi:hypothetical protein
MTAMQGFKGRYRFTDYDKLLKDFQPLPADRSTCQPKL